MKNYKNIKSFDELIEAEHGKIGTEGRNQYEEKSQMFIISEMLKEAQKDANVTQEQLADKTGTKKSYISKLENGKGNIQLSTLIRIFEIGLNKKSWIDFFIKTKKASAVADASSKLKYILRLEIF
ncbi:helix-turn-helix transcriptional regulator [Flavobacterium aquidurense]|uniref:helix-turn-helix domain-containing protein n=1 Tax=Flavobacterium aquidurense TaxID=362413 RepID=UPI00285932C8|nr:helix-turn-helix transcriptional regulator [Flavobacterium aquidurense]MDR7369347.1 transcriptional regulator with XRE-family HTH domain [Flavobacterium aquidurense]